MIGDQLYRFVYLSRACRSYGDEEMWALASASAKRNGKVGVTGLLLYDGSRFLQALEGPEAEVTAIMDSIAHDSRHDSIAYIDDKPVHERQFGSWAMQFKPAPEGCCTADFLERVKDDVTLVEDLHLRAAFIGFAVLSSQRPRGYVCSAK